MKVFVTGATGFIGTHLCEKLVHEGHEVTVLVRKMAYAGDFASMGIKIVNGDIFTTDKLVAGMKGADLVFHLAAYAKPFSKDSSLPYKTNVEGTLNILESAKKTGVPRVIITSTAGTMGYSKDGLPVSEETNINPVYHTEYERTKALTEKIAVERFPDGPEIIIVNPSRVFGPGKLSKSNSITRIMKLYGQGLWRIIPGDGTAIGNYAFIDDVVNGHILAARYGKNGERYILGGENVSFRDLFENLGRAFGKNRRMLTVSSTNLKRLAGFTGFFLGIAGKPPIITDNWIEKYLQNWSLSCNKAVRDLSYIITPFSFAIDKTASWLKTGKMQYE